MTEELHVNVNWLQRSLDASRVFTPTSPIDERSLFAGREEQVRLIVDVIHQKGQHAILYGERGVGKTSLANVLFSFLGNANGQVLTPRVNCDASDTFESVWRKAFDQVQMLRAVANPGFMNEPVRHEPFSSAELLGSPVSPDSVRRGLTLLSQWSRPVFIIDEFDRLPFEERRAFADTVKSLSDHAVKATILLVGVAGSVDDLIREHASVQRALVQVRMPRMSEDEVGEIIENGIGTLGMTVEASAKRRIMKLAQGLPHYAHLLSLYATRAALDSHSLVVTAKSVEHAIDRALKGAQQSILTTYETAVRSARKDNLFSDVLLSCARAETNELGEFAAQDVRVVMQSIRGEAYDIPTFAQHLKEFCDEKRGPVLVKTGIKRLFRYRFIDPLLQPFVIMRGVKSGRISIADLD